MAASKDIIQDVETGDYAWKNGDFKIDFSDEQHQTDIIQSTVGSWKQYPLCGVGIVNYLNSSGSALVLKKEITTQLEINGYTVNEIVFESNNIDKFTVDAV